MNCKKIDFNHISLILMTSSKLQRSLARLSSRMISESKDGKLFIHYRGFVFIFIELEEEDGKNNENMFSETSYVNQAYVQALKYAKQQISNAQFVGMYDYM